MSPLRRALVGAVVVLTTVLARRVEAQIQPCNANPGITGNLTKGCAFDTNGDLSFWSISGNGSSDAWIMNDAKGASGGSAVLSALDAGTVADGVALFQQCIVSTTPFQNYTLAFAYLVSSGQCSGGFFDFSAYVQWYNMPSCGGSLVLESVKPTLTFDGAWHPSGLALVSPSGGQSALLNFKLQCGVSGANVAAGIAFVDEIGFGCLTDINGPIVTAPAGATLTQTTCQ